jgi:hypothetical protein
MENRFVDFLERHGQSEQAKAIVAEEKREISFYEYYSIYYSYGLYVAKNVGCEARTNKTFEP